MVAPIKRKPLWLGLALLGVLVVAATLGLYH
ncbi:MAG TPA: SCO family protein, partial [Halomonas sp.]|nr:SCO family protein [Halomonas sp.]